MKISEEKEHLVLDNMNLVHYLVQRKFGVAPTSAEYDDIVSIGTIGLVKAVITFDESKGNTFSTYASRCINNEILMYYRNSNKYANNISIYEPIGKDGHGRELTLVDTIEDQESNFVEKLVDREAFIQLVSIVLNYLKPRERIVMLYRMGNIKQVAIAEIMNISRGYVSRIEKEAIIKIREVVNQQLYYNEVFSMNIVGDTYKITFASKDVSNFNKSFVTLLQNLTSATSLPDFKIVFNKGRIIVHIPAHLEYFPLIAQIIQKIDEYGMTFVSHKNKLHTSNTVSHKVGLDDTKER